MSKYKCRHCKSDLEHKFLDLNYSPPSNAYLTKIDLEKPEVYFPLRLYICSNCYLGQTIDYADCHDLFNNNYAYFSSISKTWLLHAKSYVSEIN